MSLYAMLVQLFQEGGFVLIPLSVLTFVLCYALTFRYLRLNFSGELATSSFVKSQNSLVLEAKAVADKILQSASAEECELQFAEKFQPIKDQATQFSVLVRAIVYVAPLLGLLGTVIGMIETFSSMGDMALFSQTGGIAGGISQALLTTQMGLIVAIPGLFLGRFLDGKEKILNSYLDGLKSQVGQKLGKENSI